MTILRDSVVVANKDGHETTRDFRTEDFGGVKNEIQAWANGMESGKWNEGLKPEEALQDLEIVSCLESIRYSP